MKFCIDCRHHRPDARCKAPQSYTRVDLVTGETTQNVEFARNQRLPYEGYCGSAARWFEPQVPEPQPAPSFWQRWLTGRWFGGV